MNQTRKKTARPGLPHRATVAGVVVVALVGLAAWRLTSGSGEGGVAAAGLGRVGGDLHALHFTGDGRVLYGQHAGLSVTTDGGKTWTAPSGQGDAMAVGSRPARPEVVWQAGHDFLLKSEDGGRTWTEPGFGNLPGTDLHGFAVAPDTGWLYANVAGRGLYRSTDEGRTWEPASPATGGAMALAAGPGSPPVLYAATMREGLLRSEDGGGTWEATAPVEGLAPSGVHVNPASGHVYAATASGVVRSKDGGATWEKLGPDEAMALVATDPADETKLMGVAQDGKVYRSDDGGRTWLE